MVCAKASFSVVEPLLPPCAGDGDGDGTGAGIGAGWATRGGAATRGMPAGGVGVTAGGAATTFGPEPGAGTPPEPAPPIGATGALRAPTAAAPGADEDSRCPQCWQKAKPTGVPLPQAGQIALGADAAGCGAIGCGAIGCGAIGCACGCDCDATAAPTSGPALDRSAAIVAALPNPDAAGAAPGGALASSEVPHILQKFIPGGLSVPHALQVVPAAADAGLGAAAASRRWPQSWQNSEPSRLTFPQWVQRGIARVTSRVK
jgi:hypothetical protein